MWKTFSSFTHPHLFLSLSTLMKSSMLMVILFPFNEILSISCTIFWIILFRIYIVLLNNFLSFLVFFINNISLTICENRILLISWLFFLFCYDFRLNRSDLKSFRSWWRRCISFSSWSAKIWMLHNFKNRNSFARNRS